MGANASASSKGSMSVDPFRVMIVDDSAVVRGLITRMLEAEKDIVVAASVGNGQIAVSTLVRTPIDVIVLDIEMPVMDGLTALPKLIETDPGVKVIMASTLTLRNAEISLRALNAGAADYIPKPTTSRDLSGGDDFRRELVEKIRNLGLAGRGARKAQGLVRPSPTAARTTPGPAAPKLPAAEIKLREASKMRPDILAIGSSTGGPQALLNLLKGIGKAPRIPIVITQHMPATFTAVLADHISRTTGLDCREAVDGEKIFPGRAFLAPGGFHMLLKREGIQSIVQLSDGPAVNYCRPAVDPMLQSISEIFGARTLVAILTGMGADGMKGGQVVTGAGGTVIAQDEATSVVWGMPGAVATNGLCSAVLPISHMAPFINKMIG
jgi:two-component system, chemotaxis family, protein-glutamate methylesterase/glutaminase